MTSDYTAAMARAGQSTKQLTKDLADGAGKGARSLDEMGHGATVAGAALLGIGVAAVATATTFDKQMSAVQAATGLTKDGMDGLRKSALDAGAATAFSATEAAQGQEELAKAGLATADIIGGALTGALDLAAAGAVSVADAAEVSATALKVFGLRGKDMTHVADLLAAGAGKAQGGVGDLSMALKQSALVADQVGLSIEDTTGALAQFASAGLLGSDAGTSFKSMLQRLTPQSEEAVDLMEKMGLNAYDAQGQFIGLETYAGKLKEQLSKLAPEQRNAALQTLFGSDAIRAATVLYEGGAEGVRTWRENVDDAGYASEQAAARLDNLAGDLEKLTGSLETTFIKAGSGANDTLRFFTQTAEDAVNAVGDLNPIILTSGVAAATAAGGFLLLAPQVLKVHEFMQLLAVSSPKAAAGLSMVGKAAGGVLVLTVAYEGLSQAAVKFNDAIGMGSRDSVEWERRLRDDLPNALVDLSEDFQLAGSFGAQFADVLGGDLGRTKITRAKSNIEALDGALAGMVANGQTARARSIVEAFGEAVGDVGETLPAYSAAVGAAGAAAAGAATPTATFSGNLRDIETPAQTAQKELDALTASIDLLRGTVLTADEATSNLEASIDDATAAAKKNGETLDLHTEKGRANSAALGAIATAALDGVDAWVQNGDGAKEVARKTELARKAFIDTAIKMGNTRAEAKLLADQYGLIPAKVATSVVAYGVNTAITEIHSVEAALKRLRGVNVKITANGEVNARGTGAATGGRLSGPGTGTSDSFSVRVSDGEFITNAKATARNLPLLEAINSGRVSHVTNTAGSSGGLHIHGDVVATTAPGEPGGESVARALHREAFLLGMGG